ncbi:MAG: hypothetical protein A2W91_14910 [Bacteroidetes bacterium GWF2_38_335]|nr:MAG: hypothetical protein A2W91_14910 [Bacteroidetes bacterium GWF2_38_335]OFY78489.1 MAG: hypothetical protein A2281_16220 [Bacteroidetes bacterium RIFOXYA12_FULL_38_20]HBS88437.1 hypothetical protein [Bacteroidales bacterium]
MRILFVLITSFLSFASFSQWYPLGNNISGSSDNDWFGFSLSMSGDGLTYAAGAPQSWGLYIIIRTNGREYFGKIILQNSDL